MSIVAHLNFARGFRGGEMQTLLLIQYLSKQGYKQVVGIRDTNKLFYQKLVTIDNIKIIKIKTPFIFTLSPFKSCNFIYSHEPKGSRLAFLLNLAYKIPYSITKRVDMPIKDIFINRLIYNRASYVVAISKAVKKRVDKILNRRKSVIIHDCYVPKTLNQIFIQQLQDSFKNKFIVGNIAALDAKKGQRIILDTAKQLQDKYNDIHFVFLGDGEDREYLENKAQKLKLKNITFVGFVDNVSDYIAIFDIFVFPSLSEGFGSILLDIGQAHKATISSNIGGITDIIEDHYNGLLLESIDKYDLKDKILKLYYDSELKERLAQNAYKKSLKFNIKTMGFLYEKMLRFKNEN